MKLNFKKAITRMIVKGYGISLLICCLSVAIGIALLLAPLFPSYHYSDSHLGASLLAIFVPILMVIAFAIPTKQDRADGL